LSFSASRCKAKEQSPARHPRRVGTRHRFLLENGQGFPVAVVPRPSATAVLEAPPPCCTERKRAPADHAEPSAFFPRGEECCAHLPRATSAGNSLPGVVNRDLHPSCRADRWRSPRRPGRAESACTAFAQQLISALLQTAAGPPSRRASPRRRKAHAIPFPRSVRGSTSTSSLSAPRSTGFPRHLFEGGGRNERYS